RSKIAPKPKSVVLKSAAVVGATAWSALALMSDRIRDHRFPLAGSCGTGAFESRKCIDVFVFQYEHPTPSFSAGIAISVRAKRRNGSIPEETLRLTYGRLTPRLIVIGDDEKNRTPRIRRNIQTFMRHEIRSVARQRPSHLQSIARQSARTRLL